MHKSLLAALLLMTLTSCGPPQSILHPGGPAAHNLSTIGWVVFILLGGIGFVMWLLLLWTAVRRRGTLQEHQPYDEGGGQRWIFVGGLLIPLFVLCGIFVFAMERMTDFPLNHADVNPQIQIIGHQFWWEVHYLDGPVNEHFVTANEIHIPVGKPVDLLLESADVIHSFWVPGLHGKMQLIPGRQNYLRIQASEARDIPRPMHPILRRTTRPHAAAGGRTEPSAVCLVAAKPTEGGCRAAERGFHAWPRCVR